MKKTFILFTFLLLNLTVLFANPNNREFNVDLSYSFIRHESVTFPNSEKEDLYIDKVENKSAFTTKLFYKDDYFRASSNLRVSEDFFTSDSFIQFGKTFKNFRPYVQVAFSNVNFNCASYLYMNIDAGLEVETPLTDWLDFGCDFKIGYVPFETLSVDNYRDYNHFNDTNVYFNVSFKFFDIIKVYGCIESLQDLKGLPLVGAGFNPYSVKNGFGIEAKYFITKNVGITANIEYYCKHPELAVRRDTSEDFNVNRSVFSLGVIFKTAN